MSVLNYDAHGADPAYKVGEKLRIQEIIGSEGIARRFVAPLLRRHFPGREPATIRVLDVGCGLGRAIIALRELGYDAWGLEPGGRLNDADRDVRNYIYTCFSQDIPSLHPEMEKFDLIMSHGVIEHVGTTDGNADLVPDYESFREIFIASQLALLRSGGLLLVCGPNRLFPFDFQHGHRYGVLPALKTRLPFLKYLTIPWHPRNHLVSHAELQRIAQKSSFAVDFLDESQRNYSSMSQLRNRPLMRAAFKTYITIVSPLPLVLRRHLETHTVFVCRRVAEPPPSGATPRHYRIWQTSSKLSRGLRGKSFSPLP